MNEAETRAELIDPALKLAGWGVVGESRVRREVIAPGRISLGGRNDRGEVSDYVLTYRNQKLAVIEAKAFDKKDTEGLGQAKAYAKKLQVRFAISTNGQRIWKPAPKATSMPSRRRMNCGPRSTGRRTCGATGSPPSRSRTTAGFGSHAITRRSPFVRCWRRSRRAAAACC